MDAWLTSRVIIGVEPASDALNAKVGPRKISSGIIRRIYLKPIG